MTKRKYLVLSYLLCLSLSLFGIASADQTIFYAPSSTADYRLGYTGTTPVTFSDLRGTNGNTLSDTVNTSAPALATSGSRFSTLYGFGWTTNTSSLNGKIIDSAYFSVAPDGIAQSDFSGMILTVTGFNPTNSSSLAAADWQKRNWLWYSTNISYASWSTTNRNNFTILNTSAIDQTGITNLLLTTTWDMLNSGPSFSASKVSKVGVYDTSKGDPYKPMLVVTWHNPTDTTPPAPITGLTNTTTCNSINWTWTNPGDSDFNHTMIWKDDVFQYNLSNMTTYNLWSGLSENIGYTISTKTCDITGNCNASWVNQTATTKDCTPPASITNLQNATTCTSINWTWTDPLDADFDAVEIYWNGTLNSAAGRGVGPGGIVWSGLAELTSYTFSSKTYDNASPPNYNATWVNQTAITGACGSAPVADFSSVPSVGNICAGDTVVFTDESSNTPTSWYYEFGDGNTSTVQNPSFQYNVPGLFYTLFKATNAYGNSWKNLTGADVMNVTDCSIPPVLYPPVADFSANETSVCISQPILFSDLSTNATSWDWTFGDGNFSSIQNPVYSYAYTGTFDVGLKATNADGNNTMTKPGYITVNECSPIADFTVNATCGVGNLTAQFNDTSIGLPTSWYWQFGDGNISTQQNPVFRYNLTGIYSVNHSSTNAFGTTWMNRSNLMTVAMEGTFCTGGGTGGQGFMIATGGDELWWTGGLLGIFGLIVVGVIATTKRKKNESGDDEE